MPFIPVLTTEHQAHTNSQWNTLVSNGDFPFEASRLANQIISQAAMGYEAYIFKCVGLRCASHRVDARGSC